jgi:hypothetical protein
MMLLFLHRFSEMAREVQRVRHGRMTAPEQERDTIMSNFSHLARHAFAAAAALAITAGLLVGSFATAPQRTATTTVLA